MQAKRPGVGNQEAEDAVACRQWTDLTRQFAVDPDSDEVAQRVVITDDSQGAKACMQQPAGRFHHAFQDCVQAQVLGQGDDRFQQARHAFLGLEQLFCPGAEPLQQFLNHGVWLGYGMA
jgi:hypothetical protein